ncbi:hypothetical protein GCM10022200_17580 [Microbacterium awajiense]|uniref:Beta-galactosidase trimerisation domain-containing protein n=1 Tax=Microbacterium awajiense TaxID=415214 RepID=A0ABP7AKX2_9MICO
MRDAAHPAEPRLPLRSVHLDFHTSPLIRPIADRFDPAEFAERFVRLGVDSVTLFAKCHHGQLYYRTDRPETHPGLGDGDLLREQVEALRAVGIRSPLYISVLFDEQAAADHPEWVAQDEHGRPVRVDSHGVPGWHVLDMTSAYQDYLVEQTSDVMQRFPDADGYFFDICFDQPSFSPSFAAVARSAGLDPESPGGRREAARIVSHSYMARLRDLVAGVDREGHARSIFFNSRPRLRLAEELGYGTHDEIEALPTGGWGYAYAPYVARNVLPVQPRALGMTGRFFGSWGDSASLHPPHALTYEALQMVGMGLGICIGDSLPASGRSHDAVTALLESTFSDVSAVQQVTTGAVRVTDAAVVRAPISSDADVIHADAPGPGELGALRLLTEMGIGFDFVTPDGAFDGYRMLVVLDGVEVDPALEARIAAHVAGGGAVFFSGSPDGGAVERLGGVVVTDERSFAREFVRPRPETTGLPDFDFVTAGSIRRVRADGRARVYATVTEPYFDRTPDRFSGHEYTPAGRATDFPALSVRDRVGVAAFPILEEYGESGVPEIGMLVRAALTDLIPDPSVRVDGPAHLEVALQAGEHDTFVHLLSYLPSRRAMSAVETVRDPVPVIDATVEVRSPQAPASVRDALTDEQMPFTYANGYARFAVSFAGGHRLIAVERSVDADA